MLAPLKGSKVSLRDISSFLVLVKIFFNLYSRNEPVISRLPFGPPVKEMSKLIDEVTDITHTYDSDCLLKRAVLFIPAFDRMYVGTQKKTV